MEEIGYRSAVFELDGIAGSLREYIEWLITECVVEAIEKLATHLRTPLQIEQHLTFAFETTY